MFLQAVRPDGLQVLESKRTTHLHGGRDVETCGSFTQRLLLPCPVLIGLCHPVPIAELNYNT
jgi:hypothetical protein